MFTMWMIVLLLGGSYFTGLPNAVVTKIIVDEVNGKVKASTYGRGIWESDGYYGAVVGL